LFHYGYSDFSPREWSIAVPRTAFRTVKNIEEFPMKAYYIQKDFLTIGKSRDNFNGVTLPVYDRERTICDCFKYRTKLDNEIFNKAFLFAHRMTADLRFITGSDCHDWKIYPKETVNDTSEFRYTYVKCLPTFRGLVMAITDHRRIKTVNSFFNPTEIALNSIDIKIDGIKVEVQLSKGINVIIGDNSIGKSLILHKLTGYCKKKNKLLKSSIAKSYDKYLKDNKIKIDSVIDEADLFGFDMQGEVRSKFEEDKIKSDEFLKDYYPAAINPAPYRLMVEREINKIFPKTFDRALYF